MKRSRADGSRGAIVLTGAASGLGRVCAFHLRSLGFHIYAGLRTQSGLDAFAQEANEGISPIHLDVTDLRSVEAAAATITSDVGDAGLAGLVNNAGVALAGPIELLSLDQFRRVFDVNVFGLLAVTRALIPLLRQAKGRIVNIGSISGRSAMPFMSPYAASKFALEAISDALRVELRPWEIQVALLEPGSIATPMADKFIEALDEYIADLPPQAHELYGKRLADLRGCAVQSRNTGVAPEKIARIVAHALTARRPKARYLAGSGTRFMLLIEMLPSALRDRIIERYLDKYGAMHASSG